MLAKGGSEPAALGFAWGELGMLFDAYQFDEPAEEAYGEARRLAGESDPRWSYYLAQVRRRRGELEGARELLAELAREQPRNVPVLTSLAAVEVQLGRAGEAEARLRSALTLEPKNAVALYQLAQLAAQSGRDGEAVERAEAALAEQPRASAVHFLLATLYTRLGRVAEAARHRDAAGRQPPLQRDPWLEALKDVGTGARIHLIRGSTAMKRGQLAQAIAEFQTVLRLDPSSTDGNLNLGAALAQARRFAEAIPVLEKALELPLDSATRAKTEFNLGMIFAFGGDRARALEHLERAQAADPGNAAIAQQLKALKASGPRR